jgi:hypothetical protein
MFLDESVLLFSIYFLQDPEFFSPFAYHTTAAAYMNERDVLNPNPCILL